MRSGFPFFSPKSNIKNQPCRAVYGKIQLINGLLPGSVMLCACPRPLFHGSGSWPIVDLHALTTARSATFAYAAATPAGTKKLGAEAPTHHARPASRGFAWLASLGAARKNCPLPFPQRKAQALEPHAVSQSRAESLEAASSHPAGTQLPQGTASRGAFWGSPCRGH